MSIHEIVLPETKPETEWVRGRALQKMSPVFAHGLLQLRVGAALAAWASEGNHGRVATEWRFRVAPPNEIVRPLVPDVGYLAYEALGADAPDEDVAVPLHAPTVAVEILSPRDRRADVDHKTATYLAAGSAAVITVDPRQLTIAVYDTNGARVLRDGDVLAHRALPGFTLGVRKLFEGMKR